MWGATGSVERTCTTVKPDRDITEAKVAKALAHPLRVRILGILEERVASPRELALELDAELSQLSYHVRTLHRGGFIELVEQKRRRAAIESYYRATERPVVTSDAWAGMPSVAKKQIVSGTLGQMGDVVNAAISSGGFERDDAHLSRSPMVLDARGFAEVADKMDKLLKDFERIAMAAEKRLERADHEGAVPTTAVMLLFETAPGSPTRDGGPVEARGRRREVAAA